jgi:hypothetical protein
MTAKDFRSLALGFPGVAESEHMQHPDFRCRGKVFATLDFPEKGWGMVKLTPGQQRSYLRRAPGVFRPASGAWGKSGSTTVQFGLAQEAIVKAALSAAFKNVAALNRGA